MPEDRILRFSRAQLRALIAVHGAMFDKLLDGEDETISDELIALFKNVGATYAEIHASLVKLAACRSECG